MSASEAAIIAEQSISVTVDSPLPVRACDEHAPTTLLFQLKQLCAGGRGDAAVLIANEKTVLFMAVGSSSIVLVDTHRHGLHGSVVLLGQRDCLDPFIHMSQNVLDLRDDTYANRSFIPLNDFPVREVHPDYQLSSSILHHRKEMVSRAI